MERIAFVGPGRLGLSLGSALVDSSEGVELIYFGRREEPPAHPLFIRGLARYHFGLERPEPGTTAVILTVPDSAISEVAAALAARGQAPPGCAAFHCSGALGADPLASLHQRGYPVGTLHPLQAVASPRISGAAFQGSYFALSGEPEALSVGRRLLALVGGRALMVPASRRPLYHAAAVLASNYIVILLREAIEVLREAGVPADDAEAALLELAKGTIENVGHMGAEAALTGPLERGDVETIELHLRAVPREQAALYVALGRSGLSWLRNRLPGEVVTKLEELFRRYG
jgi:predicted short-subunit dehydrogenase-like oxidoreductase (DUF2520 family)